MNDRASRTRSLDTILDELNEALEQAPDIDDEGRAAVEAAVADIREALDSPDDDREESLREQLAAAVERFEVDHPQLTGIVGRIADILADLGI